VHVPAEGVAGWRKTERERLIAGREALSLSTGRTTVMQGAVHLVVFAVYLFTTIIP